VHTQVLIAGAGPTGLTLAIELARRSVDVRVIDRAGRPATGSRGDTLQPRILEVLDDLGVLDAVLADGSLHAPIRAYAGGGFLGERRMSDICEPTPDVPYPNPWVLGQAQTEGLLRDRLAELGGRVEFGTELVTSTQDPGGVTTTLRRPAEADGDPGGVAETVRAAYLVGADGGASTVRRTLDIPFDGSTDESIRMLLGDVRAEDLDHDHGHWFAAESDLQRGVILTPLPGSELFQFACPLGSGKTGTDLATLQAALDRFVPESGPTLTELTWATVWRPNVRLARRFRDRRVFLVGDAAHAHPPTGGQGLNSGVQDAYNLGWKLAAALAGHNQSALLLDSYEAERRPVAAQVLAISSDLLPQACRRHIRRAPPRHRDPPTRHRIPRQPTRPRHAYRARPAAGRRPGPDAPVLDADGRTIRLFDLFRGPHATMLAFGTTDAATEPATPVYPVLRPGERAGRPGGGGRTRPRVHRLRRRGRHGRARALGRIRQVGHPQPQ
jgi:2-polyprenyl-6-methoxyphenol hydroxylase-like FAD-dependent oxidoreductase